MFANDGLPPLRSESEIRGQMDVILEQVHVLRHHRIRLLLLRYGSEGLRRGRRASCPECWRPKRHRPGDQR